MVWSTPLKGHSRKVKPELLCSYQSWFWFPKFPHTWPLLSLKSWRYLIYSTILIEDCSLIYWVMCCYRIRISSSYLLRISPHSCWSYSLHVRELEASKYSQYCIRTDFRKFHLSSIARMKSQMEMCLLGCTQALHCILHAWRNFLLLTYRHILMFLDRKHYLSIKLRQSMFFHLTTTAEMWIHARISSLCTCSWWLNHSNNLNF